jgi:murein DD-endopeptidase MepM/ murein hydrolase activator NlpD
VSNLSIVHVYIYILIILSTAITDLFAQQPLFLLPYSSNSSFPHQCVQGNRGQPTHNSDTTRFDLDFDTPNLGQQGDPENVLAAANGTAYGFHTCDANNHNCTSDFGNYIKIDHGSGTFSFYAHLSKIVVASGTHVNQGDIIGEEGSTGLSFGDHIHFGVHTGDATLPDVGRSILIEQLEVIDQSTNSGVQITRGDELICGLLSEGDPVEGHIYVSTNITTNSLNILFQPFLQGRNVTDDTFTITILDPSTQVEIATFSAQSDPISGTFALPPTVPLDPGIYDLLVHSPGYLRKKVFNIEFVSNITISLPELRAGDLNNDNTINSLDWSIMNPNWFTSDLVSDINRDGLVNSLDFGLMNSNWSKTGD